MNFRKLIALPLALSLTLGATVPVQAAQALRNLVAIEGVRDNPLVGYGLVVGLNGSGDSTQVKFSSQSVINMPEAVRRQGAGRYGCKIQERCHRDGVGSVSRRATARASRLMWWCRRWATPRACAAAPCC